MGDEDPNGSAALRFVGVPSSSGDVAATSRSSPAVWTERFVSRTVSVTDPTSRSPTASMPVPMIVGAIPRTRRSTSFSAKNDVITRPPPSTSSEATPSARSLRSALARSTPRGPASTTWTPTRRVCTAPAANAYHFVTRARARTRGVTQGEHPPPRCSDRDGARSPVANACHFSPALPRARANCTTQWQVELRSRGRAALGPAEEVNDQHDEQNDHQDPDDAVTHFRLLVWTLRTYPSLPNVNPTKHGDGRPSASRRLPRHLRRD